MKTLRLLLFALLVTGTANAQYFQRVYGTPNSRDVLESGTNYDFAGLPVAQKGQVMAGYTDFGTTAGLISPMVTRTLLNGNPFAPPVFNNTYQFNYYGRPIEACARRVITYPGGRIGVIGDYTYQPGTPHTYVFYMLLNGNGTLGFIKTYAFPNSQFQSLEATSITPSVAPAPQQNAYACGIITDFAGGKHPFVLSIQAYTGMLNWGHEYRDIAMGAFEWTAEDLIESPYPNVAGTVDVALVGRYVLAAGGAGQGNLFTVDAATGAVTSFVHEYGTLPNDAGFNAIIVANNPFNGGVGYAIAGFTFDNTSTMPTYNMWALKVSPIGQVQFSSQMDYSLMNCNDYGYDIVERFSATFGFQYFVGGYVDQGIFGQEDEVVYKLDFAGNPFGGGPNQFTYGGPGWERILQMDYYENGVPANNVGLSAFNWTVGSFPFLGAIDFYHVKSYFNGVTPIGGAGNCNSNQNYQLWMPGPPLIDSTKGDTINYVKTDTLMGITIVMQQGILCLQNAVVGGSNLRTANPDEFPVVGSTLSPNPVSTDNPLVNLTFDVPGVNDVVDIELWNALGQLVMQKQETLGDGQTLLQLNLGTGLSAGVYSLMIRRGDQLISHKIAVQ